MPSCCVPLCNSCSKRDKMSFHQIPADMDRRFLWLKAIARKDPSNNTLWEPNQYSTVCQKHFKEDDYHQGLKKLRLKKDAIPSVFPGYPDYLQPKNRADMKIPIKSKTKNMLVELSNSLKNDKNWHCDLSTDSSSVSKAATKSISVQLPDSLENDKNGHCDPITVSSISKAATKTVSVQLSDVPKLLENDKNMLCDPISIPSLSDVNLSILHLENENAALKLKKKALSSNLNRTKKKVQYLKKINKSLLAKNAYLKEISTQFSDIKKEAAEGSSHAIFIMDQIRSRNKKLHRWNPEIIKICKLWHECSPSGYNYIQQSKFLNLPNLTTLKKYVECQTAEAECSSLVKKKVLYEKDKLDENGDHNLDLV